MIARLTYDDAALGRQTATLEDDARWTGSDPEMVETLNLFLTGEDRSPSRGDWLAWHAGKMAEMLGAAAEYETKQKPPPDLLY